MGGEIGVKTVVYNTKRDKKKNEEKKENRTKKEKNEQKVEENTIKRKNTVLSIILLGHDRGYFLCLYMYNFFLLILSSNIFSLNSD